MDFTSKEKLEKAEELDKLKSKVLKYVLYKKRTESEVREKFSDVDEVLLEDVIDFLKEYNYINDEEYIQRSISEFKALKNLSIKQINYKLLQKGINKNLLETYISEHYDEILDFEKQSAKNIFMKKSKSMEVQDIKEFLYKNNVTLLLKNKNEKNKLYFWK